LAERADLHRTYIAGIERGGRNITLKSIEKLAKALEVSIAHLLSPANGTATESGSSHGTRLPGKFVDILLVEDSPDDVEMTLEAFREAGIANRIHVVSDGARALEYLFAAKPNGRSRTQQQPQVILLDLHLPKVSGLEVLRRLKRDPRTRTIPVIVLTVSQKSEDIIESRRLGAEAYIVKPVAFRNLSEVTPQLSLQWALVKLAAD
jgi:CheY-like chemotaxis protein